jgi:hypothetical protein
MIQQLDALKNANSWDEMRGGLGDYLGLEGPVPSEVLNRAINDKLFAHNLMVCRNNRRYLDMLLRDPKNEAFRPPELVLDRGNMHLLGKAARAFVNWGKGGFAKVDEETFNQRFGACQVCPHLVEAPNRFLYKIKLSRDVDNRVCSACGCVAARKAKLPTERCPVADPNNLSVNRWGQPVAATA